MHSIFLILVLAFFNDFGIVPIDGYVLTENGSPIEGVHVFFRGYLQSGAITNSDGYFSLNDIKSTSLIFSHVSYKEKEVDVQALGKRNIRVILTEDKIQLDEIIISSHKITDVTAILNSIKKNYYKNSYSKNVIRFVDGEHLAKEGSDSLILLKSPFLLKFYDYPRLDADSDIFFLL